MDKDRVCLVCKARISRSTVERALWLDEHGVATSSRPVLHPHNPDRALTIEHPEPEADDSDE